jgi:hypothetical protein
MERPEKGGDGLICAFSSGGVTIPSAVLGSGAFRFTFDKM